MSNPYLDAARHIPLSLDLLDAEPEPPEYAYLMCDEALGYHKIGMSRKPEHREKTLQAERPVDSPCVAERGWSCP